MTAELTPNFCPFCGTLTREAGSYCHACGQPLVEKRREQPAGQEGRPSFCCLCGNKWPERGTFCSRCGANAEGIKESGATDHVPEKDTGTESAASTSGVTSGVTFTDEPVTNNLTIRHYGDDTASQSNTVINPAYEAGVAEASQSATADTPSDETTADESGETVATTGSSKTDLPSTPDGGSGANSDSSETPVENTSTPLSKSSGANEHEVYGSQYQDVQGTGVPTNGIAPSTPTVNGNPENRNAPVLLNRPKTILGFDQRHVKSILLLVILVAVAVAVTIIRPDLFNPAPSPTQQPVPEPNDTAVSPTTTVSPSAQPSPTASPVPSPSPSPTETPDPTLKISVIEGSQVSHTVIAFDPNANV